jgi:hypothetical protein
MALRAWQILLIGFFTSPLWLIGVYTLNKHLENKRAYRARLERLANPEPSDSDYSPPDYSVPDMTDDDADRELEAQRNRKAWGNDTNPYR